jgi:aspartate ammonia-lyase
VQSGRSVREIVLEQELLAEEELDAALDVLGMTKGGIRKQG